MSCDILHLPQSWDWSCLKILRTLSSPQECTPTGLKKLAGTSANIESWESSGILRNPQESCRNHRGTVKTSFLKAGMGDVCISALLKTAEGMYEFPHFCKREGGDG
jgi:hypothetical protein